MQETVCREWIFFAILDQGRFYLLTNLSHRHPETVLGFKIERTDEELTAHGGLALMAEYNHGIGLKALQDEPLPTG